MSDFTDEELDEAFESWVEENGMEFESEDQRQQFFDCFSAGAHFGNG